MNIRVLTSLALLVWASPATAEKRDPLDQLALEVAVVAAHEGALDNREDTALIWQVVAHRANTTQSRLDFLRLHSPKALGIKECVEQNCVWSVELLKNPDAPPASIDRKWWEKVREQSWRETLRYARGLVYGIDFSQPCPGEPYTWGGAMDVEGAYADRNLIPLGCVGVLNEGFTHAPRVISARDAARIRHRRTNGRSRRHVETPSSTTTHPPAPGAG